MLCKDEERDGGDEAKDASFLANDQKLGKSVPHSPQRYKAY